MFSITVEGDRVIYVIRSPLGDRKDLNPQLHWGIDGDDELLAPCGFTVCENGDDCGPLGGWSEGRTGGSGLGQLAFRF